MAPVFAVARRSLARFSPPVWRILLHSLLFGLALSIADLLFNFYLVSLGYAVDTAGLLSTVNRAAGLVMGLPIGLLIDRIGPRRAVQIGLVVYAVGWCIVLGVRPLWALALGQFSIGAAYLLAATAVTPLLITVTPDAQRATVLGMNASAGLIIGLVGSLLGGLLPTMAAGLFEVAPQSTTSYRIALALIILLSMLALLPLLGQLPQLPEEGAAATAGNSARLPVRMLLRYALAGLLLGFGGGALLPFQNLFFRQVFGLNDAAVGVALALAALGMGLGALLGSPVAERLGLRRGAALLRLGAVGGMLLMLIPSLAIATAGFFLRGLFVAASYPMNDALVMRATPPAQRGMAMSVISLLWSGGWALTAAASGYVQLRWGFTPVILFAAVTYVFSALAIFTLRVPER